jgi:hypothetical protein
MECQRLDVHLEEYRTLRSEIEQRIHQQLLVLGGSVALIVAAVPAVPTIVANEHPGALLLGAAAFVVLGWLYIEQELLLLTAAWYIQFGLRPAILEILGEELSSPILGWEDSKWTHPAHVSMRRPLPWFRTAATVGPASLLWLGALVLRGSLGWPDDGWVAFAEAFLFVLAITGTVVATRQQIQLQGRRYPELSGATDSPPRTAI